MQNNVAKIYSGKITKILKKPEFEYTLETAHRNSGSPICLANNLIVVGINNKGNINKSINYGTFLGCILDDIENENNNNCDKKYLNNIKSVYIIKKIFSNVNEKTKLKVIKYSKKFQKKINISLINYKLLSGRYIKYEINGKGKGKEYNEHDGK